MKVKDLKKALAKLPPETDDYEVSLEGCDCYGDWNGEIEVYKTAPEVKKKRPPERDAILLRRDS